ncbi:MAG: hypothetical protein ACOCX9_07390 [Spirochaetota bacterium]
MKKLIISLFTLPFIVYFLTCDRADMQTIARYGPEPDAIYFFSDNAPYYGDFSGNDPHTICNKMYTDYFSSLDVIRIEPFLSTTEKDVRDIVPDVYSHVEVIGVNLSLIQSLISNSWNGLWDGGIDGQIGVAISYWTGSTESGTLATGNCKNWTDQAADGFYGDGAVLSADWIKNTTAVSCSSNHSLVCVGY